MSFCVLVRLKPKKLSLNPSVFQNGSRFQLIECAHIWISWPIPHILNSLRPFTRVVSHIAPHILKQSYQNSRPKRLKNKIFLDLLVHRCPICHSSCILVPRNSSIAIVQREYMSLECNKYSPNTMWGHIGQCNILEYSLLHVHYLFIGWWFQKKTNAQIPVSIFVFQN